jgi:hypothetical protein
MHTAHSCAYSAIEQKTIEKMQVTPALPQRGPYTGLIPELAQNWKPNVVTIALVISLIVTGWTLFELSAQRMVGGATTSIRLRPGDANSTQPANTVKQAWATNNMHTLDVYYAAAKANLTDFQARALSISVPFFGISRASERTSVVLETSGSLSSQL